jgi:hypothetical protein
MGKVGPVMSKTSRAWVCGLWAIVMALILVGAARGQGGKPKAKGQAVNRPEASADPKEARQARRALLRLYQSVRQEDRPRSSASSTLPGRPAKTVMPPTLTPADIDRMLDKDLAAQKTAPARLTTDEEFVRRVFLDVVGKLPAPERVIAFVRDRSKDKRARLIDELLNSRDYAANWAHYWRDVIRFHAPNETPGQVRYPKLEEWFTEQFAQNRPWDEIATDLITAEGPTDENGAVVFPIAELAQPVEMAGEVSRIFLGIQIQCAQCHDHPNDSWKRQQFHEFAAFFAGMKVRAVPLKETGPEKGREKTPGKAQVMRSFAVITRGKPKYTMPDLKDPHKSIPVAPRFFLASQAEPLPVDLPATQRRALAASYITGQDNPWFARAFVNRIWTALMGEGFYNPVDDLGPGRAAEDPEVLDALASQWQKGGYDIRWLFRVILNTKAYQRESRATNTAAGRTPFAANCPSRLRGDQILDALSEALGLPLDAPGGKGKRANPDGAPAAPKNTAARGPRFAFNVLFGVDPSTPADEVLGTIPQALFLMNSPQIHRALKARPGTALGEILASSSSDREALEILYLRILARRPSPRELAVCANYMAKVGNRGEAFEDIAWSLINSTEFVSRR